MGISRHGHSFPRTPTYISWQNMIARCTRPSNPAFKHYKMRGITVCDRWLTFENFLDDMGVRPDGNYSIDRINNNGNYEPSNCRWATKVDQANNRITNNLFEYRGKTYTLANLVRETGVSKELLRSRLVRKRNKNGRSWTVEEAVSEPLQRGNRSDLS